MEERIRAGIHICGAEVLILHVQEGEKMKNTPYKLVEGYLKEWHDDEERRNAMRSLLKLDKSDRIIFGKPSSIAIALICYSNEGTYKGYIDSFKKQFRVTATEYTVRKHTHTIGEHIERK
jgi:hypothetical protein